MHTLALDGKNRIWSWGGNDSGVLGRDTSQAKEVLKDIDGKMVMMMTTTTMKMVILMKLNRHLHW